MAVPNLRSVDRGQKWQILADVTHVLREKSGAVYTSYFNEDPDQNETIVPEGLIIAKRDADGRYAPYHPSKAYGDGTDTAVGILDQREFATNSDPIVDPVTHGKVIEAHCLVYGSSRGTISDTIKSQLKGIHWI